MLRGILRLRWSTNKIERDPEADRFRALIRKEGLREAHLAVIAGLADSTVKNLTDGKTRRAQHLTYAKIAEAMNFKYGLTRNDNDRPDYDKELPKAREERRAYRENLRKKRNGHKR